MRTAASAALAMALTLELLLGKQERPQDKLRVSDEELYDYCSDLQIELSLEEIHRKTDLKYEPATLATIFTNRDVKTWRESA